MDVSFEMTRKLTLDTEISFQLTQKSCDETGKQRKNKTYATSNDGSGLGYLLRPWETRDFENTDLSIVTSTNDRHPAARVTRHIHGRRLVCS